MRHIKRTCNEWGDLYRSIEDVIASLASDWIVGSVLYKAYRRSGGEHSLIYFRVILSSMVASGRLVRRCKHLPPVKSTRQTRGNGRHTWEFRAV